MVYLFVALYPEAKALIQKLHMKRVAKAPLGNHFSIYEDAAQETVLCITGPGPVQAAAAVGSVLTVYDASAGDLLISFGSAAGISHALPGRLYLGRHLTDTVSGRSFYPDLLLQSAFPEAELLTGARILTDPESAAEVLQKPENAGERFTQTSGSGSVGFGADDAAGTTVLYDMESAAVFQSASNFLGPHQMSFLRVVSDLSAASQVTAEGLKALMENTVDPVAEYVDRLRAISRKWKEESTILQKSEWETVESFAADAHFSQVMHDRFLQHIRYLALSDVDWKGFLEKLYAEGQVPTRDKRAGKAVLDRLEAWMQRAGEKEAEETDTETDTETGSQKEASAEISRPEEGMTYPPFRHIYVEKALLHDPRTERVLRHFPKAKVIAITHYKDLFNRRRQDYRLQHQSQNLILAEKHGQLVYPGAPVCQSFGNQHFYYTSCLMNCLFDCEYCYLKGMYPSGNLVLFVNLEDIFREVEALLMQHPVYLCISYDTDLLAVEDFTGYVEAWIRFVKQHPDLSIEIRTKSARKDFWERLRSLGEPCDRVIFAFTISPDHVTARYEHRTGSLSGRLDSVRTGLSLGYPVRLCFDPMIVCPDWQRHYHDMIATVAEKIPLDRIRDVSVGSFRLSEDYLKNMRRAAPCSAVVQYPYENDHGVMHYPQKLTEEMEQFLLKELAPYIPEEKIFRWEERE